ncbi:MAG: hypothetical protein QME16_00095 [Planctomycetota bacterium]|nr:hypothetical protein [Planctomycetota bacterium]
MKFLIVFFLLTSICLAEEFTKDRFYADKLLKEIELFTGIILSGKNQQGYMNTVGDKIEIKLNERELTAQERKIISDIIKTHNFDKVKQEEKQEKLDKKNAIKQKLNLTDDDLENLGEALSD